MTEAEWLTCDAPGWMLANLGCGGNDRKVSLYRVAMPSWGKATTAKVETPRGVWRGYGERGDNHPADLAADAMLIREVFGNPFRPVALDPAWVSDTVSQLATAIYKDRAFDRLPLLADALEDAGCDNAAILDHCRGPGPHVRGCWVVDLLLGKE